MGIGIHNARGQEFGTMDTHQVHSQGAQTKEKDIEWCGCLRDAKGSLCIQVPNGSGVLLMNGPWLIAKPSEPGFITSENMVKSTMLWISLPKLSKEYWKKNLQSKILFQLHQSMFMNDIIDYLRRVILLRKIWKWTLLCPWSLVDQFKVSAQYYGNNLFMRMPWWFVFDAHELATKMRSSFPWH